MTALPSSHVPAPTDTQLACAAAAGDRQAFAQIYALSRPAADFIGMLVTTAPPTAYRTYSPPPQPLCLPLRQPDKLRPGCMRSRAARRCAASATAGAGGSAPTCPRPHPVSPAPTPWLRAASWPI